MTKSELIVLLAEERGINDFQAYGVVNEIFAGITETLAADGRVEIRGFGTLANRLYQVRSARNPKTGESVILGQRKNPFFKTGKTLREKLKAGND